MRCNEQWRYICCVVVAVVVAVVVVAGVVILILLMIRPLIYNSQPFVSDVTEYCYISQADTAGHVHFMGFLCLFVLYFVLYRCCWGACLFIRESFILHLSHLIIPILFISFIIYITVNSDIICNNYRIFQYQIPLHNHIVLNDLVL